MHTIAFDHDSSCSIMFVMSTVESCGVFYIAQQGYWLSFINQLCKQPHKFSDCSHIEQKDETQERNRHHDRDRDREHDRERRCERLRERELEPKQQHSRSRSREREKRGSR